MVRVHTLKIVIDWKLISEISKIDRFDASWSSIEKREGQSLKQLKSVATVRSVGASTRIEGSKMSDTEVEILLQNLDIEKFTDRDSQEVAGYFEVLDLISESYDDIAISENSLKNLHNLLLKYSEKDKWHKGDYKQHSNSLEASLPDGTIRVVFETTPPGVETEDAMRSLMEWYKQDSYTHPLVSRLLTTLLLLKNGYRWIQFVSFEHEIENRKTEYYVELRKCQAQRPNEDVTLWVYFFLDALSNIKSQLLQKLESTGIASKLSPREKSILTYISENPGSRSGTIATKLNIPNPTVKRLLSDLVNKNLLEKFGVGPGTNYSVM